MPAELPAARGAAGDVGLLELSDGSLVHPDRFDDRYGRGVRAPHLRSEDSRTETERDRGRLGYSSSLRRLAGVTQVVSPDLAAARMHSRESHTHKVALVARELAELVVRRARTDQAVASLIHQVGGLDIAACEAAGLAHDLGHAPFGHAGEVELHNLLLARTDDGFEGNPQSFRIVTRLDGRTLKRTDLDLTNVTLCAILKYPWDKEEASTDPAAPTQKVQRPPKYGAYAEDRAKFTLVRSKVMGEGAATNRRQSLEASIMDLADDIAYAIHDLEDFCAAGMIDLYDVRLKLEDALGAVSDVHETNKFETSQSSDPFTLATRKLRSTYDGLFDDTEFYFAVQRTRSLINQVIQRSGDEDGMPVVLRDYLSGKIGEYFSTLEISDALPYSEAAYVRLSKASWHEVQVLKVITRHWLIGSPQMGVIQRAQTRAIRTLFDSLVNWLESSPDAVTVPKALHEALTNAGVDLNQEDVGTLDNRHYRAIGDYISGLSDSEALLRSNWFAGRDIPGMTVVAEAY
ncbi:dGTP triphosphohydrolase [Microbacterium sp. CGR1]|uniref:dGTP triphosphohydrolase n=1 Tax=Microbacterium sp. CGR1 TaxID=1696072 RepID=UPI003DA62865